jgi:PadR family transcriptional regulator PadR
MLGEFEYLLITAAAGLGDDAYGAAIREAIETHTREKCSIGEIYTTIDRLETKGLLKTWMGEATAQRGGRAKRMIRVTPKGVQAASDFYNAVTSVSRGVAWATKRAGSTT